MAEHKHEHGHEAALEDDGWWDEKVEALLDAAEAHFGGGPDEQANERYLLYLRMLIDTGIEQLQSFALHNPCGDGEVIELQDGTEACAGCFEADGSPRG